MRRVYCNRCGAEFNYDTEYQPEISLNTVTTSYEKAPACFNLCANCYTQLRTWFNDPDTEIVKSVIFGDGASERALLRDFEKWYVRNNGFYNGRSEGRMVVHVNRDGKTAQYMGELKLAIDQYLKDREEYNIPRIKGEEE